MPRSFTKETDYFDKTGLLQRFAQKIRAKNTD